MTESYRLHAYWRSSASWRVRIALAYKGIDFELHPVNIAPGTDAQQGEVYRQVNPMAQVPTLERGDLRLTQSMAIFDYLESVHPEPRLFPSDPVARAQAIQAAEIVNAGVQPLQNIKVLGQVKQLGGDPASWSRSAMNTGLQALEQLAQANGGRFSVGDAPTIADCCLIPQLYNARRFSLDLGPYPHLLAIESHCQTLEAFVVSRPEAQPDSPETAV